MTTPQSQMEIFLVPWVALHEFFQPAMELLDEESKTQILRFKRPEDAWRGLLGRHLILYMLRGYGLNREVRIERTQRRKPYLAEPHVDPPILFNLAHDNGLISLAFSRRPGDRVNGLGVDCMRLQIRSGESPSSFVDVISSVLTVSEYISLKKPFLPDRQIERAFIVWTLKEAYIKAIGSGMSFELTRMDCRLDDGEIRIDGDKALGWEFRLWAVEIEERGKPKERYAVASAEFIGPQGRGRVIFEPSPRPTCRILPFDVLLRSIGLDAAESGGYLRATVGRLFW